MKDKLLYFFENLIDAFWKLLFVAWIGYMTIVCIGLWTHLHRYAMEALK